MARHADPINIELEELLLRELRACYPKAVSTAEAARMTGQMRQQRDHCWPGHATCPKYGSRPPAPTGYARNHQHHELPVQDWQKAVIGYGDDRKEIIVNAYDTFEYPVTSAQTNPVLNRLATRGLVEKTRPANLRCVMWLAIPLFDPQEDARHEEEALEIMMRALFEDR